MNRFLALLRRLFMREPPAPSPWANQTPWTPLGKRLVGAHFHSAWRRGGLS